MGNREQVINFAFISAAAYLEDNGIEQYKAFMNDYAALYSMLKEEANAIIESKKEFGSNWPQYSIIALSKWADHFDYIYAALSPE